MIPVNYSLHKASLSSTLKYVMERQYVVSSRIGIPVRPEFRQFSKDAQEKALSKNANETTNKDGLLIKLLRKVGIHKEKYVSMFTDRSYVL